jgi:predicted phosphodiesterase
MALDFMKQIIRINKMKIQVASDLHLEFLENRHAFEEEEIIIPVGDVLVLAGDISNFSDEHEEKLFQKISTHFEKIIYIPGNHEYYHSNAEESNFKFFEIDKKYDNVIRLNNNTYEHNGVKFICSTLWSGISKLSSYHLNDYIVIGNFDWEKENEYHDYCLEFVESELKKEYDGKVVVVSHHLPVQECISEKYKGNPINDGFAGEADYLFDYNIDLWIHGHSHDFSDITYKDTRIVRNPRGFSHEWDDFKTGFAPYV